jgi:hypothetical protein
MWKVFFREPPRLFLVVVLHQPVEEDEVIGSHPAVPSPIALALGRALVEMGVCPRIGRQWVLEPELARVH